MAGQCQDITPEQADYISRKLDELADAANRLGRKDWINFAMGMLANIVISAALEPDGAKFLFKTAGHALEWLFGGSIKLLP